MKHIRYPLALLALSISGTGLAGEPINVCKIFLAPTAANNVLTTFVFINAHYHGQWATSDGCPEKRVAVTFAIGKGRRTQSFLTSVFRRPAQLSGLREIQATVSYSENRLVVTRVHAYRELTEQEASPFQPRFSPREDAIIRKALDDAADAADKAAHR